MIKPCGLVCCVAYPYALAILCPVSSVALLIALCSLYLCCHRRYLNLACLHASPRSQHLSHCLLALPFYSIPRGLRYCHRHHLHGELLVCGARPRLRGVLKSLSPPRVGQSTGLGIEHMLQRCAFGSLANVQAEHCQPSAARCT